MKIKLKKQAVISGEKCNTNTIHDVPNNIGNKLISRDYAEPYSGKEEVKDNGDTSHE